MLEVGRAQRTIFLCRYLRSRDEQREVNAGLNVVESWNGANTQIQACDEDSCRILSAVGH